jgi:hypothetical protein
MQKKDLTTGLALTFFFGPVGMLYTSVVGFLTFLIINIFLLILFLFVGSNGGAPFINLGYFIVLLLELYWTYNVLIEKNKRIDNKQIPMTTAEEFDLGFQNITSALLVFLVSIFFTCCIHALLSLTHILDKTSNSFQGFIFFIILIAFLLTFSFVQKNKKLA